MLYIDRYSLQTTPIYKDCRKVHAIFILLCLLAAFHQLNVFCVSYILLRIYIHFVQFKWKRLNISQSVQDTGTYVLNNSCKISDV